MGFVITYRQRKRVFAPQLAQLDSEEQAFLSAIKQRSTELAQTQAGRKLLTLYAMAIERTQTLNAVADRARIIATQGIVAVGDTQAGVTITGDIQVAPSVSVTHQKNS